MNVRDTCREAHLRDDQRGGDQRGGDQRGGDRRGQTSPLNVRRIGGVTMAENYASWSLR